MPLLLVTALLGIWAYLTFGEDSGKVWHCTPIDSTQKALPPSPCFRALLSKPNLVTLQWRTASHTDQLQLIDTQGPDYRDVGDLPIKCRKNRSGICEHALRVASGGLYRWALEVRRHSSAKPLYVSTSLVVPSRYPPRIEPYDFFVDVLSPSSKAVTWQPDERNLSGGGSGSRSWIEARPHSMLFHKPVVLPRSGSGARLVVSGSALSKPGIRMYELRDCYTPRGSDINFCSDPASVGFYTGADHFLGEHLKQVEAGESVELSFTSASGDVRKLDIYSPGHGGAPRHLGGSAGTSLVLDPKYLRKGVHRVTITSCLKSPAQCANTLQTIYAEKDGIVFQMPEGFYRQQSAVALFFPGDGSPGSVVKTAVGGNVEFADSGVYRRVEEGQRLASVLGAPSDQMYIHVGPSINWELGRDYLLDFAPGVAHRVFGAGDPLDVTYDSTGNLWALNEFSNNVEFVSVDGQAHSYELPMARTTRYGSEQLLPVRPFAFALGGVLGNTHISSLAERITTVNDQVWLTQGGGMIGDNAAVRNHSRLVMFDPALQDLPNTLHDDRFCVYNLPADDAQDFGNNQVIGLAASRGRIWFAEMRGAFGDRPSVISSFIPDARHCNSEFDYADMQAQASRTLVYCTEFTNPEQDGCIEHFSLEDQPRGVKVAHLARDPEDGSIWFTDAHGRYLGNLDPAQAEPFKLYALPDNHARPFEGMWMFGGFPWSIKVDREAVYFGEYATHHLLRFDKAQQSFSELHVPCTSPQIRLHSIDIDHHTRRLWFTLTNEVMVPLDARGSTIGYVNLDEWAQYANGHADVTSVHGVIYRGLESVVLPGQAAGSPYAFRGIDVNPDTGNIALATMLRDSVTRLRPLPGTWP